MGCRLGLAAFLAFIFTSPLAQALPGLDLALISRAINYEDEVCHPVTEHASDTVPPCLELVTIETVCTPNGTSPLALKAHQQCMCRGSFFNDWPFCLQCLFIHGLRSERDVAYYQSVLETASDALCNVPTPTAEFASIFDSVQYIVATPTTGNTITSDQVPGQTAVSLYFTATANQGPGAITGPATAATAPPRLFTAPRSQTTAETEPHHADTGPETTASSGTSTQNGAAGTAKPASPGSGTVSRRIEGIGLLMAGCVAAVAFVW